MIKRGRPAIHAGKRHNLRHKRLRATREEWERFNSYLGTHDARKDFLIVLESLEKHAVRSLVDFPPCHGDQILAYDEYYKTWVHCFYLQSSAIPMNKTDARAYQFTHWLKLP